MGARIQSHSAMPQWVGRYEIVRPIARGGMAEVYLARTRPVAGIERLFAIKCCHPHLREDHEFASMFLEEARLAAQIRHPNVVATFDVGDDEMLYLVMEYVEGEPLSELIKAARSRGEPLPLPVTLRIVADALTGLHAAHETRGADGRPLGVVHRDVSPQNILVGVDGVARIVDFGIAKAEASATVTREGQVKGKLAYLPPEQLTEHVMTRRGDVYAMGVVLWETLTCHRLFSGQNAGEIALRVLEKVVEPPSVQAAGAGVPAALDAAVLKALERDPQRRFATAADLALALETCGVPLAAHRTVGEIVAAVHAARNGQSIQRPSDRPVSSVPTPPTLPGLIRPAVTPSQAAPGFWRRVRARSVMLAVAATVVCAGSAIVISAVRKSSRSTAPGALSPLGGSIAAPTQATDPPPQAARLPVAPPSPSPAPAGPPDRAADAGAVMPLAGTASGDGVPRAAVARRRANNRRGRAATSGGGASPKPRLTAPPSSGASPSPAPPRDAPPPAPSAYRPGGV